MQIPRNQLPVYIAGAGILVLLIVGSIVYTAARRGDSSTTDPQVTADPSASPSPSSNVQEVPEPTPTPSSTPSPTAIPTTGTLELPESAKSFLANFYAAYKEKDRTRLEALFTADTAEDMRDLRSRLFTGFDLKGNPGGPTLFSTNSAAQWVTNYELLGAAPQEKNWIVTVKEQRQSEPGGSIPNVTTLVTLVPAPSGQGTWLIDFYIHAGSNGKYDGFLTQ